ncbi:MAG: hypothetical protein EHM28_07830 [Spirochaetaceae bacterium]|nr:MAG: hypothetical protein EHM28_07830 [Spirochaetaceae bacterium]
MANQIQCVDCALHYEVLMDKTMCGPGLEVDRCKRCGGIWLDRDEMIRLSELGRFYATGLDKPGEVPAEKNPDRKCPHCKQTLAAKKVEKLGNVELDECPKCGGVWCDHGELMAVMQALE